MAKFQSTRPMRGATAPVFDPRPAVTFQSTRPMRGATRLAYHTGARIGVSIHAPHAGRDVV